MLAREAAAGWMAREAAAGWMAMKEGSALARPPPMNRSVLSHPLSHSPPSENGPVKRGCIANRNAPGRAPMRVAHAAWCVNAWSQ